MPLNSQEIEHGARSERRTDPSSGPLNFWQHHAECTEYYDPLAFTVAQPSAFERWHLDAEQQRAEANWRQYYGGSFQPQFVKRFLEQRQQQHPQPGPEAD